MWNDHSNYKKSAGCLVVAVILIVLLLAAFGGSKHTMLVAHAATEDEIAAELGDNIDDILNDIDSGDLDDFLIEDLGLDLFDGLSFKEIVFLVLSGDFYLEYDSVFGAIWSIFKDNLKSLLSFFLSLVVLVVLFEIFKSFCSDKYGEIKKSVQIVFFLVITLLLAYLLKNVAETVTSTITTIFNFSKVLFPILLSLVLVSGASSTYSVYSSLSVFLLNTGSYLFVYILLPMAVSIMLLSLGGGMFNSKRFSKANSILKTIFKYVIVAFLSIFSVFSAINAVSSGASDGVTYKLTRFAIKSYIPVLGGYLSDGFDFLRTCAVMVKNSFGIVAIIVLLFMVLKPILMYLVYLIMFKILSAVVMFIGNGHFAEVFENVSKSISYFITVLVGVFMCLFVFIYLLILSVSVV